MQEFKFACPVCGQHITAAASAGGTQLECPTCFRKIIVPQAPTAGSSKLILSAAQVEQPRPGREEAGVSHQRRRPFAGQFWLQAVLLLGLAGAVTGGAWLWGGQVLKWIAARRGSDPSAAERATSAYPVPTNITWTVQLGNVVIPQETAVGRIHGSGFRCEHATLQGGSLTLRQGKGWPPDLGLTINLYAQKAQDLSGKTIVIAPQRPPPLPKVMLRWKSEQGTPLTFTFEGGYLLKTVFGQAANGRMPGQLYIALPDKEQSFIAGSFDAVIRPAKK